MSLATAPLRHNHTDECIFNLPRDKPSFGLFLRNGGIDPVTYGTQDRGLGRSTGAASNLVW